MPLSLRPSPAFVLVIVCILSTSTALKPTERAKITFKRRIGIAVGELAVGPTCHLNNGDEASIPDFAGQFHKSLPHDQFGQVRWCGQFPRLL